MLGALGEASYPWLVAAGSLETLFHAFHEARVRYLVVGGVAVVLHGHPRFTADLDLVLALDAANLRAAVRALDALGYTPRAPVDLEELADPDRRAAWVREKGLVVFSLASPAHPMTEVDVFVEQPFPFEEAHARALWADLGTLRVPVASLQDLIAMKRRAGRPQDLEDVRHLEEIARDLEQGDG